MGQRPGVKAWEMVHTALAELAELVVARGAAKEERTALSNRQGAAESKFLVKELKKRVKETDDHIESLDAEIEAQFTSRLTKTWRAGMKY